MKLTPEQQKIVADNHNLIYSFANKYKLNLNEYYDLLAIGLCKAVITYNEDKKIELSTYAYKCMYNTFATEIRNKNRRKRLSERKIVSLDNILEVAEPCVESSYDEADTEIVFSDFTETLTNLEKKLVRLLVRGYNQTEICEQWEMSNSYICNMLKNIKKKYERFSKKEGG